MEDLVRELFEEFIMSEAASRILAVLGEEENEAQDILLHLKYQEHANLCKKAAQVCSDFLKTKNFTTFFDELIKNGLDDISNLCKDIVEIKNK